ncbi:unnamed protein product [Rotaria sp. Silwood2]|nr:unnamed protein product [Rotaria sp. Silwood2]
MTFAALVSVLLLFVPQSIIGEPIFETIPLRFDVIIQQLRGFYQRYPDIATNLVNTPIATIRPELLLTNISFSTNQSTACKRDLEILITAASRRQLWAMKVFDAWGKPLPSGLLKGNVFWLVSIGSILGLLLYYPSMVTHALDISNNATGPNFFDKIYMTPWCRISPYAIGLFTGFLVVNTGRTYHLNSFVRLIGNLIATALALACIFSIYGDYVLVPGLSRASLIVYQTLSRPAWSISISWLIFCVVSIKVVLSIEYYLFPFGHR